MKTYFEPKLIGKGPTNPNKTKEETGIMEHLILEV